MRDGVHIRLTLTRGVKITSGMDPRLNRSGPDADRARRAQAARLLEEGPHALITSSQRRSPPDCLDPKIHHANLLSSILAKIQANAAGADDALMLDLRGFIAETNATHLFMVQRRRRAHADARRLPRGHHARDRARHLPRSRSIPHEVRDISLAELYRADEAFCTGTMGELAGVTQVDGRRIGDGDDRPDDAAALRAVRRTDRHRRHAGGGLMRSARCCGAACSRSPPARGLRGASPGTAAIARGPATLRRRAGFRRRRRARDAVAPPLRRISRRERDHLPRRGGGACATASPIPPGPPNRRRPATCPRCRPPSSWTSTKPCSTTPRRRRG